MQFRHKKHKNNETYQAKVEELHALTEKYRGKPFANELTSNLDSTVFLDLLLGSARTPLEKLQASITLAKTVGLKQVAVSQDS